MEHVTAKASIAKCQDWHENLAAQIGKKKKKSLATLAVIVLKKVLIKYMYLTCSTQAEKFYEPETLHVLAFHSVWESGC